MKIIKMTPGKFADTVAVALLLSFMFGISLSNLGEYPYAQAVEMQNLIASSAYVAVVMLFIYFSYLFSRKSLLIFNAIIFTISLLFSVWYFAASVSAVFVPNALIDIFSLFTFIFHTQFIGFYFFIDPINDTVYSTIAFVLSFAIALFSWFLLLKMYGYFEEFRLAHPKKPKKEHLSKVERMRREIASEKKAKSALKIKNGDDSNEA